MRFALALEGVSVVLPSAVTIAQLDEDVGALGTPGLTKEEFVEMRQLEARVQSPSLVMPEAGAPSVAVNKTTLPRAVSSP
jgi:hypothetical protein